MKVQVPSESAFSLSSKDTSSVVEGARACVQKKVQEDVR